MFILNATKQHCNWKMILIGVIYLLVVDIICIVALVAKVYQKTTKIKLMYRQLLLIFFFFNCVGKLLGIQNFFCRIMFECDKYPIRIIWNIYAERKSVFPREGGEEKKYTKRTVVNFVKMSKKISPNEIRWYTFKLPCDKIESFLRTEKGDSCGNQTKYPRLDKTIEMLYQTQNLTYRIDNNRMKIIVIYRETSKNVLKIVYIYTCTILCVRVVWSYCIGHGRHFIDDPDCSGQKPIIAFKSRLWISIKASSSILAARNSLNIAPRNIIKTVIKNWNARGNWLIGRYIYLLLYNFRYFS